MHPNSLQSQTITALRFPLIVAVVLIHAYMTDIVIGGTSVFTPTNYPVYASVATLLSHILARIAVPLFFILSGFLFFQEGTFNRTTYVTKLKKRARTVLVPYLLWNLIVIGLFFMAQTLLPSLISGVNKPIMDYTIGDWLDAFWAKPTPDPTAGNMPINYPLWFIRDLMVVMVLSPVIYLWVKHLSYLGVLLLGALWFAGVAPNTPGLNSTALFFFSVGAVCSVHNRELVDTLRPACKTATISYVALVILDLITHHQAGNSYVHNLGILSGCISALTLTAWGIENHHWHVSQKLAGCSFFVYAFHGMPLALIMKVFVKFIPIRHDAVAIALYLGSALLVIVLALSVYTLMQRYTPRLLAILTGGR